MLASARSSSRFSVLVCHFLFTLCMTSVGHSAELFGGDVSGDGGAGIELDVENGYPTIVNIIPGGPADLQGELTLSDHIVGVGQGIDEIVDVIGWPLGDVITLIRGKVDSELILQVIPNGGGDAKLLRIVRGKVDFTASSSEKKVKTVTDAAEAGDAEAQYQLAMMYFEGEAVPVKMESFIYWLTKSAENGLPAAQNELGLLFSYGNGVEIDPVLAVMWLEKSARQDHSGAQNNLAVAYQGGNGVAQDTAAAVYWYEKSAGQGYALAQANLGQMYSAGIGVEQDYATAYELFILSAKQGNGLGTNNLGVAFEHGWGVAKNSEKAFQLYQQSAEQGNARGQANLASAYSNGIGTVEDKDASYDWFKRSAEQGDVIGMHGLGSALYWGQATSQDQPAGINWLLKAAEQGYLRSQATLGYAYSWGDGVKKDAPAALKWNTLAAERGDDLSQERLGSIYYWGDGVDQDRSEAYKWFLKSAAQGNHDAEYSVGVMYSFGQGVALDYGASIHWYKKAVEGRHAGAQFNLAVAYDDGLGVEEDDEKAVDLYARAAALGNANAQYNLGSRYRSGEGVVKDLEKAVELFTEAADSGHMEAKNSLAMAYEWGSGVSLDEAKAKDLFIDAARAGSTQAAFNLGIATSYGDRKHASTSLEYLTRAYKQGITSAGYRIAVQHLDQNSGFYSPQNAYAILQGLVAVGKSDSVTSTAFALLGYMYSNGVHVKKDIPKALEYYAKLQPQSVHSSVLELVVPSLSTVLTPGLMQKYAPHLIAYLDEFCGSELKLLNRDDFQDNSVWAISRSVKFGNEDFAVRCFDRHIGSLVDERDFEQAADGYQFGIPGIIEANQEKAFEHMLMAAEADSTSENANAMNWVGVWFEDGFGIDKDEERALYWYQKAADLEFAYAINNLGWAYEKGGLGLEADNKKALTYYKKAYAQDIDCAICITNLARMYEEGIEDQDLMMAKILYSKAFELGDLEAGNLLAKLEFNGLAGPPNSEAGVAILQKVILGNAEYRESVGKESHDVEIKKARKQLVGLGALDKSNGSLNLGNYHALVIGNASYDNLEDLTTARRDASDVAKVLEQEYGFKVELLLDATRENMLTALNRFRGALKETDNFLLYYAGHGYRDETGLGYWQPTDSSKEDDTKWIPNTRINQALNRFKSNNIILIADSCYAGTQFRGFRAADQQAGNNDNPAQSGDSLLQRLSTAKTRVAITSGGDEPVADRIGLSVNSVFATSFIQALKNNSKTITSGDIFNEVRQRVVPITAARGLEQTPEFGPLYESGHEGGDFIFNKAPK